MNKLKVIKFFSFLCTLAILNGITSSYSSIILTTLENRFSLNSKEMGILNSAVDAGYAISALTVTYLFASKRVSFILGLSSLVAGLAIIFKILPFVIFGQRFQDENGYKGLVSRNIESHTMIEKWTFFSIFYISNFFIGAANPPLITFGLSHLDMISGKSSGLCIGLLLALSEITSPIGYFIAKNFLEYHEGLILTRNSSYAGQGDMQWIGAYWLGFIPIALSFLILMILLFLINTENEVNNDASESVSSSDNNPGKNDRGDDDEEEEPMEEPKDFIKLRKIRKSITRLNITPGLLNNSQVEEFTPINLDQRGSIIAINPDYLNRLLKIDEKRKSSFINGTVSSTIHESDEEDEREQSLKRRKSIFPNDIQEVQSIFKTIRKLLKSKSYLFLLLGSIFDAISSQLLYPFFNKTLEFYYRTTPVKVADITFVSLTILGVVSNLTGGILACKWPLTTSKKLLFIFICQFLSSLIFPFVFACQCKQPEISQVDNYCVMDSCEVQSLVCIENRTHIYPFKINGTCTCGSKPERFGYCEEGCDSIYYYMIVIMVYSFIRNLSIVHYFKSILALVEEDDRSMALGFYGFSSCIVSMIIPILSGALIDYTCQFSSKNNHCLLYDTKSMKMNTHGSVVIASIPKVIAFFFAWFLFPRNEVNITVDTFS